MRLIASTPPGGDGGGGADALRSLSRLSCSSVGDVHHGHATQAHLEQSSAARKGEHAVFQHALPVKLLLPLLMQDCSGVVMPVGEGSRLLTSLGAASGERADTVALAGVPAAWLAWCAFCAMQQPVQSQPMYRSELQCSGLTPSGGWRSSPHVRPWQGRAHELSSTAAGKAVGMTRSSRMDMLARALVGDHRAHVLAVHPRR
jgi:hypothetical protein